MACRIHEFTVYVRRAHCSVARPEQSIATYRGDRNRRGKTLLSRARKNSAQLSEEELMIPSPRKPLLSRLFLSFRHKKCCRSRRPRRRASPGARCKSRSIRQRVTPPRLPADAPNILIILIDDAGPALPSPSAARFARRRWSGSCSRVSPITVSIRRRCVRRRARHS